MTETVNKIEENLTRLREELQKNANRLNEVENLLKQLKNERLIAQKNIDTLSGAIQAYSESVRLLNEKPQE